MCGRQVNITSGHTILRLQLISSSTKQRSKQTHRQNVDELLVGTIIKHHHSGSMDHGPMIVMVLLLLKALPKRNKEMKFKFTSSSLHDADIFSCLSIRFNRFRIRIGRWITRYNFVNVIIGFDISKRCYNVIIIALLLNFSCH